MATRISGHNQASVPVLDKKGQPLCPARPSRVRSWIESGRATKTRINGIFAVQLENVDASECQSGHIALNVDPGQVSGIAITLESEQGKNRTIVGAYEHRHRNRDIKRSLDKRRMSRRRRRSRLRHRPARFNNRANSRAKGRLAPSVQSLAQDIAAIAQTMLLLYPIKQIRMEYEKIAKLRGAWSG